MDFNATWTFILIFLMIFALGLLIAGIFTVYFGSGKSRGIGAGLLIAGIIIGLMIFLSNHGGYLHEDVRWLLWDDVIFPGAVFIGAAALGGLAAIGMFLLAIMKS